MKFGISRTSAALGEPYCDDTVGHLSSRCRATLERQTKRQMRFCHVFFFFLALLCSNIEVFLPLCLCVELTDS